MLNLIWVPFVVFAGIAIPDKMLTIPILAAFVVSVAHFVALYRLRVQIPRGPGARRGVRRDVGAVDGGARGRLRPDQGPPAVRAHRQGRRPQGRATSRRSGRR